MKIIRIILKVLLCLLIVTPIFGAFGIFPEPTADLYNSPEAFAFIQALFQGGYIIYMMAAIFAVSIGLVITNRMALVALLILPITINIIAFHMFLDGGIFTGGAIMGNILFLINIYFLWESRAQYRVLWNKSI
ncbi:MAG: hypothetical protein RLY57_447 [Candidatus Parcubacteria bacterium]|jgi:hypothetical protein